MRMVDIVPSRDLLLSECVRGEERRTCCRLFPSTTPREKTTLSGNNSFNEVQRARWQAMTDAFKFLILINLIILLSIVLLCILYILTIFVNRRFHTAANILTGNVCLCSIVCCLFWVSFNILTTFYSSVMARSSSACVVSRFLPDCANCLIIYSLAMITINRFVLLIYRNKAIFKRKVHSLFSSAIQWFFVPLLCIPQLVLALRVTRTKQVPDVRDCLSSRNVPLSNRHPFRFASIVFSFWWSFLLASTDCSTPWSFSECAHPLDAFKP